MRCGEDAQTNCILCVLKPRKSAAFHATPELSAAFLQNENGEQKSEHNGHSQAVMCDGPELKYGFLAIHAARPFDRLMGLSPAHHGSAQIVRDIAEERTAFLWR
jgi:hypothetical protein